MQPSLLIFGFAIGLLIGLTSLGGAALMTPFLILGMDFSPVLAIGTDLLYGAFTRALGAWVHWKQGTVDVVLAARMWRGSIPGCLVGALAVGVMHRFLPNADIWFRRAIGATLVTAAALLLLRTWPRANSSLFATKTGGRGLFLVTFIVGFLVGFTSVGSGSVLAPILLLMFPNAPARAVGTDLFHGALLGTIGALAHAASGHIAWPVLPVLLLGSLPGVLAGSYLAPRLPARWLRGGLALALLASGARLF